MPGWGLGAIEGVVTDFDEPRGLGVVRGSDGVDYPFHCTAIADGSRTIEVGAEVHLEIGPGPMGRWEARRLTP